MWLKSSGAKPMRNLAMVSGVTPRPVRYSRARAASGPLRAASKYWVAASWMSMSWRRRPASLGFFGGAELALGEGDAAFGGDDADGLGEADVLHLHDEGEDVALFVAAEAVEVAVGGVDGEAAGFFFVEGAEAGVVLGSGFAEFEVVADDADDVGLLLDELGEVIGHAEGQGLRGTGSADVRWRRCWTRMKEWRFSFLSV